MRLDYFHSLLHVERMITIIYLKASIPFYPFVYLADAISELCDRYAVMITLILTSH